MVKRRQPKKATEEDEQEKGDKEVDVPISDEPTEVTEESNLSEESNLVVESNSSEDTKIQEEGGDSEKANDEKEESNLSEESNLVEESNSSQDTKIQEEGEESEKTNDEMEMPTEAADTEVKEVNNSKEDTHDSKEESDVTEEIDNPFYEESDEEEKKESNDTEIEESEVEGAEQPKAVDIVSVDVEASKPEKTSAGVENTPLSLDEIMPDDMEDLDFEPEEAEPVNWLGNVASPSKAVEEDDDDIICLDVEDIDTLGDEIDAACPASKMPDNGDSDGEKRSWRSEKSSTQSKKSAVKTSKPKQPVKDNERSRNLFSKTLERGGRPDSRKPSSPKRRIPPAPRGRQLSTRKSRSSSIEIISERSRSRSKRRRGSKRRSHGSNRHSISPPSRNTSNRIRETRNQLMETREMTEAIAAKRRRVEEDLRRKQNNFGSTAVLDSSRPKVRDRVGQRNNDFTSHPPPAPVGFKVVVKNFPDKISESEFFSMFVRKGEVLSCEMKKNVGFVTFKTKAGANKAKETLNGTKNGNKILSVRDAMPQPSPVPHPNQMSGHPAVSRLQDRIGHDARDRNMGSERSGGQRGPQHLMPDAREKLSRSGDRHDDNNMQGDNFGMSWQDVGDIMRGDNSYQGGNVGNMMQRDNFGSLQGRGGVSSMMRGDNFGMSDNMRGNNFSAGQGRNDDNMSSRDNFESNQGRNRDNFGAGQGRDFGNMMSGDNFGNSQGRGTGNMMSRDNFGGNQGHDNDIDMNPGDNFGGSQGRDDMGMNNIGMNQLGNYNDDSPMDSYSFKKGQTWGGGGFTKSVTKPNTGGLLNNMMRGRSRESLEDNWTERDMDNDFDNRNETFSGRSRGISSRFGGDGGGDPYRELEDLSSDLDFADRQRDVSGMGAVGGMGGSGMGAVRGMGGGGMGAVRGMGGGGMGLSSNSNLGGGMNSSGYGMMDYNSMGNRFSGGSGSMGITGGSFGNSMGSLGTGGLIGSGIGSKLANFSTSFTIGGSNNSSGQDVDLRNSSSTFGETKFQGSVNDIRRSGRLSGIGMSSQGPPKSTWSAGGQTRRY